MANTNKLVDTIRKNNKMCHNGFAQDILQATFRETQFVKHVDLTETKRIKCTLYFGIDMDENRTRHNAIKRNISVQHKDTKQEGVWVSYGLGNTETIECITRKVTKQLIAHTETYTDEAILALYAKTNQNNQYTNPRII